ncbi:MAG: FG-GAP repeat domain-containing protein, partial [Fimbriiglobus sp.]
SFQTVELFKDLVSETHAAHFVDIDGDGQRDLVTGKRKYSHYLGEPGADKPATIYWLKATKGADGVVSFAPHVIDPDSGIGTQFTITDMNGDGLPDVVSANKLGVRVIVQKRK